MPIDPLDVAAVNALIAFVPGDLRERISTTISDLEAGEMTPAEARSVLHRITGSVRAIDWQLQKARHAVRIATGDAEPGQEPRRRWRRYERLQLNPSDEQGGQLQPLLKFVRRASRMAERIASELAEGTREHEAAVVAAHRLRNVFDELAEFAKADNDTAHLEEIARARGQSGRGP